MNRLGYTTDFGIPSGHYANEFASVMEEYGAFTPDNPALLAPVDVTFTAPDSGHVLVMLSCDAFSRLAGDIGYFAILESGSALAGSRKRVTASTAKRRITYTHRIDGLTPSSSHTYVWGWEGVGADDIRSNQADIAPFKFEVWEVTVPVVEEPTPVVKARRYVH